MSEIQEANDIAVKTAAQLFGNHNRHKAEGNVQSDVESLLRSLDLGTMQSQYRTGGGFADIYLPNKRTFIECKAFPNAEEPEACQSGRKESTLDQLTRYVQAEIHQEINNPGVEAENSSTADWTGIITDGLNWHFYRYTHTQNSHSEHLKTLKFLNESDELVPALREILGEEMVGKEWVPVRPGNLFTELRDELDEVYKVLPEKSKGATNTKKALWFDMMRASGMVPSDEAGQERLFLAHSFLIVIVRMVSWTLSHAGESELDIRLRNGFQAWVLDSAHGSKWKKKVQDLVSRYDWKRRRSDVLRNLYEQYVDESDRKVFGEFYTPDWLAELMVNEVLDDAWIEQAASAAQDAVPNGIGVLDPACGSGTFLYHATLRLVESEVFQQMQPGKRANVAARLVNGMDIHPVAVEIARVNIERALPAPPSEGSSALHVYLGDSLQATARNDLFNQDGAMRIFTPKGYEVELPMTLVQDPLFHEHLRQIVTAATKDSPLPVTLKGRADAQQLDECKRIFTEVIKNEGNSVWTWYAINMAGPHLLAERKIDRIVANPPWVKLSEIQVKERKRVMEQIGKELNIQGGGKQAPNLDIASYFILRTRELYTADPQNNPAAWLVKESAIQSGQWAPFRNVHKCLAQSLDLRPLQPFGGGDATRCCVLFECRGLSQIDAQLVVADVHEGMRRPSFDDPLKVVERRIRYDIAPNPMPQKNSEYDVSEFRRGAEIHPHVLTRIENKRKSSQSGWIEVKTSKSIQKPWKFIENQMGTIPEHWARTIMDSKKILSYIILECPKTIIPLNRNGTLLENPGNICPFWEELNELYEANRGRGKSTPQTLINQFDHRGKLSAQLNEPTTHLNRPILLYPCSGDNMRAVRTVADKIIVDSTLYWKVCKDESEAGFLTVLLNTPCLNRAFAESRESGRDFHLHPWRKVPIPRYNENNPDHQRLAELCEEAEEIASCVVEETLKRKPNLGQIGLSPKIREKLADSDTGKEIDEIAARILPEQAVTK